MKRKIEERNNSKQYGSLLNDSNLLFNYFRFKLTHLVVDYDNAYDFFEKNKEDLALVCNIIFAFNKVKEDIALNRKHTKDQNEPYEIFINRYGSKLNIDKETFSIFNEVELGKIKEKSYISKDEIKLVEYINNLKKLNTQTIINNLYENYNSIYDLNLNFEEQENIRTSFVKIRRIKDNDEAFLGLTCALSYLEDKDIELENHLIYFSFTKFININRFDNSIILINPSSAFILKLLKDESLTGKFKNVNLYFSNKNLSDFFKIFFKKSQVYKAYYLEDLFKENNEIDYYASKALMFGNHIHSSGLKESIYKKLARLNCNKICVLDSDIEFEYQDSFYFYNLEKMHVDKIYLLPDKIINSSKKQRKMYAEFSIRNENSKGTYFARYSLNTRGKYQSLVPYYAEEYFENFDFNNDLIRNSFTCMAKKTLIKTNRVRNKAQEIAFSKEIHFFYTCSKDEKNQKYRLKVITAVPDTSGDNLIFKNSNGIDRTIKTYKLGYEKNPVEYILNDYPYCNVKHENEIYSIRQIIIDTYLILIKSDLSLKSFVYLYPELEKSIGSKQTEDFKVILNSEIGNLCGDEVTWPLLEDELNRIEETTSIKRMACENYISYLIDKEIEKGCATHNEIKSKIRERSSLDYTRQKGRDNLTIKNLSFNENVELIRTFKKRSLKDYKGLGALIRILTGLESNIICALKWKDFIKLDEYNDDEEIYYLDIHSQLTNDGKEFVNPKRKELYRKFPCNRLLRDILLNLKNKVLNENNFENIEEQLIILGDVKIEDYGFKSIAPKKLSEYCIKEINKVRGNRDMLGDMPLGGDKGIIETDFLRYNGDLLKKNYQHYALKFLGFESGEVDYLQGKQSSITYSRYYCDYGNCAAQKILYMKQNRVVDYFLNCSELKNNNQIFNNQTLNYVSRKTNNSRLKTSLRIDAAQEDFELEIKNKHGFDLDANLWRLNK